MVSGLPRGESDQMRSAAASGAPPGLPCRVILIERDLNDVRVVAIALESGAVHPEPYF